MALKRRITVAISAIFIRFAVKRDCNGCFFFSPVPMLRVPVTYSGSGPIWKFKSLGLDPKSTSAGLDPILGSGPVVTTSVVDPEVVPDLLRF